MGRLLIVIALFVVVGWWLFGRAARVRGDGAAQPGARRAKARAEEVQDLVPCAHCGIRIPRSEAVTDGVDVFCGEPHRLLGPRS